MVRQEFHVQSYWEVIIYYSIHPRYYSILEKELQELGLSVYGATDVLSILFNGRAKGVTCSSYSRRKSVVLFNSHNSIKDYLNSIVHEAEHIKQAMLKAYQVEDRGEAPAYTIGYLVGKMYQVFRKFL